jgi:hypothetical protein
MEKNDSLAGYFTNPSVEYKNFTAMSVKKPG